ncbi:hypothetical protein BJ944DRAFT_290634 [Cunninghamella echinulata]|nr:hypothetical protein BJ944DRAFT_290634 [Cunninghamella echinulata]
MAGTGSLVVNYDTKEGKFEFDPNSIEDKALPYLISKIGQALERIPSYRRPPIKTFQYGMEPFDWLFKYEERAKRSGWINEEDKLSNVKDFLGDRAALWLIGSDIKTWKDFIIKFRHNFQAVYDVKIIDQAIKDASNQMNQIYDLEKKHHTVFKKKLCGYSSKFIASNAIGFIPAVLSCTISDNITLIFVLTVCIIAITTIHASIYYYVYIEGASVFKVPSGAQELRESCGKFITKANELKDKVLDHSIKIKEASEVIDGDLEELQAQLLPFLKPAANLKITDKWLRIEKKIQWITGGLSALTIIILIHSISKAENMNLLDAARVLYVTWIFVFIIGLIIYKKPEHELNSLEERYGCGKLSPLTEVVIV